MQRRVKGPARFEHAVGGVQQLPHRRDNDLLPLLSALAEPFSKRSDCSVPTQGYHRRHEQRSPQPSIADLGEPGAAPHGGAGLPMTWNQARVGRQLPRTSKPCEVAHLCQQYRGREFAHAGDRNEQVSLLA